MSDQNAFWSDIFSDHFKGVIFRSALVLFVNFYIIRYRDTVEQSKYIFSHSIHAKILGKIASRSMYGEAVIISLAFANEVGKCVSNLFHCISVTDGIKITKQNNPIHVAKEPLYLETEFLKI